MNRAHLSTFVIDDDPINNLITKKKLQIIQPDIKVTCFDSAESALHYLSNEQKLPELILLDINMPGMNGWEFLDSFEPKALTSKVVILTSSIDNSDYLLSKNYSSVIDFISKPISKEKLTAILGEVREVVS